MNENEFSIALGADDGAGIGNVLSKTTRPDYTVSGGNSDF